MDNNRIKGVKTPINGDADRLPEVVYQKRLLRRILFSSVPSTIFYAALLYYYESYVQSALIVLLFINYTLGLLLGFKITTIDGLIRLKRYSAIIGFFLFTVCVVYGMLFIDMPANMVWCFFIPLGVILFLGKRTGFYLAMAICIISAAIIVFADPARLFQGSTFLVKLDATVALFLILGTAFIAENTRVRVQKDLIAARNNFRAAEERQRNINEELQREIALRVQSERALARSESRYRALFEESAISLWEEDWSQVKAFLDELPQEAVEDLFAYLKQHRDVLRRCIELIRIKAVNRATLSLYEADTSETLLKNLVDILPSRTSNYMLGRVVSLYLNRRYDAEHTTYTLSGRQVHILISSTIPAGYEESFERVFTSVYDITERVAMDQEKKRVDQQLQQARQMQAVATLAGGIAHQFNNALAVIFGGLELIEPSSLKDPENKNFFESLNTSAHRMSRLTDQLLAYAQGGKYQPKDFSANDLIKDILKSGRVKSDSSVRISTELSGDVHLACGDVTQIKMVVEAVLANAVESFNDGGDVIISTGNRSIGSDGSDPDINLAPGDYAVISVKDTGVGMDAETCQRIFEPFFTTKFFGRGLGMAAAYGIVTNHDGMITVSSALQKGTCVNILLPAAHARRQSLPKKLKASQTAAL